MSLTYSPVMAVYARDAVLVEASSTVKCPKCGCTTDRFGFCIVCFRYVPRQILKRSLGKRFSPISP